MTDSIEAIFEDGVLKPLSAAGLKDKQRYRLTLEEADDTKRALSLDAAHPVLGRIRFNEDPSLPLDPEDWPEDDADHN
jgi:predicted DNA-binding antitoxin AbrB/MazE fold protein